MVDKELGVAKAITDALSAGALVVSLMPSCWLIFAAFMIGIGYENSGLGRRIALFLVAKLGKSSLGLGYAIAITDLVLAPFIPSNAARSGGTIYPIVSSICPMFDLYPDKNLVKLVPI